MALATGGQGSKGSSKGPTIHCDACFPVRRPCSRPVDRLGCVPGRLFREWCVFHRGNYVKDLEGAAWAELSKVIIVDNSPASYIFHPENAVSSPRPKGLKAPAKLSCQVERLSCHIPYLQSTCVGVYVAFSLVKSQLCIEQLHDIDRYLCSLSLSAKLPSLSNGHSRHAVRGIVGVSSVAVLVLGTCSVSCYLLSIFGIMTEKVFVCHQPPGYCPGHVTVNSEGLGDLFNRSMKNE